MKCFNSAAVYRGVLFCLLLLISAQSFSTSAREIRGDHSERTSGHSRHQSYHYSAHRGHFFNVSAAGRVAIRAPFGAVVVGLPMGYREIHYRNSPYFHFDGVFYQRHTNGYVVVQAPRVRYIPFGARRVVVDDEVYFVHNDTWYCHRNGEYELCGEPVSLQPDVVNTVPTTTIMIENSNGSRTPVELEPAGPHQWKGPQGEYYDGLPTEDQLRDAYGF